MPKLSDLTALSLLTQDCRGGLRNWSLEMGVPSGKSPMDKERPKPKFLEHSGRSRLRNPSVDLKVSVYSVPAPKSTQGVFSDPRLFAKLTAAMSLFRA
mmetsp:Transcript_45951/g.95595  ORF Transcript_45951/g.95595 Transcript_45951/m.95595 type:complete len:98 (-) Transcript_45951:69-362(-)